MKRPNDDDFSDRLTAIPSIYFINMDQKIDRYLFMKEQFTYWNIDNYMRISAYDGRNDDLRNILEGGYPEKMSSCEIGCVTSHLKALKHWLDHTEENVLLVMEDDCDLSTAHHWGFNWQQVISNLPYGWDVIQLTVINDIELYFKIHKRFVNDFSTACYMITRHHAEKLIKLYCRGKKFKLDQFIKPRAVADDLIYNSGDTYSIPLFLYKIHFGSDIHESHIRLFHEVNHNILLKFWESHSNQSSNMDILFDFDPYLGRLPPRYYQSSFSPKIVDQTRS